MTRSDTACLEIPNDMTLLNKILRYLIFIAQPISVSAQCPTTRTKTERLPPSSRLPTRDVFSRREPVMSRCQVCNHDQRWRIELLRAGGASLEALAQKFGIHRNAIHRHWLRHVTPEAKASFLMGPADFATLAEKAAKEGDCVLDYLKVCRGALLAQLAGMQAAGDARGVAYVVGQLTRTLVPGIIAE